MRWRKWIAAVAIGASAFGVAACDDGNDPDLPETETETEIPGVDAPEVEAD